MIRVSAPFRAFVVVLTLALAAGCGAVDKITEKEPKEPPILRVKGVSVELRDVLLDLYEGEPVPTTRPGLATNLEGRTKPLEQVTGEGAMGTWKGTRFAAVTVGRDVTLAVDDGGWKVVGGWWPELGLPTPRLGGVRHVSIFGSDARHNQDPTTTRTDSIHIMGFNGRRAGIVGIPRDTWVPLSTGGSNKINAALTFGGPEAQWKTVNNYTGINTEGYILTGFKGFRLAVNAIGGVRVFIERAIESLDFPRGWQRLGGYRLLFYARDRYHQPDGDFGRSRNQGGILMHMAEKVKRAGILQLPKWIELVQPHVVSNLSAEQLITLSAHAFVVPPKRVGNEVAIGGFGNYGGQSVVLPSAQGRALFNDLKDGYFGN